MHACVCVCARSLRWLLCRFLSRVPLVGNIWDTVLPAINWLMWLERLSECRTQQLWENTLVNVLVADEKLQCRKIHIGEVCSSQWIEGPLVILLPNLAFRLMSGPDSSETQHWHIKAAGFWLLGCPEWQSRQRRSYSVCQSVGKHLVLKAIGSQSEDNTEVEIKEYSPTAMHRLME